MSGAAGRGGASARHGVAAPGTARPGRRTGRPAGTAGDPRVRRRRRPSGEPPPLPRHLNASGKWWLAAQRRGRRRLDRRRRHRAASRCFDVADTRVLQAFAQLRSPCADPRRDWSPGSWPRAPAIYVLWLANLAVAGRAAAVAAPVRLGRRRCSSSSTSAPAWPARCSGRGPTRSRSSARWAGLLDAVPADDGAQPPSSVSTPVLAGARPAGSGRSGKWVIGGLLAVTAPVPALPGPGPPDRHRRRRHPRRGRPAGRLPAAGPQRRLPGDATAAAAPAHLDVTGIRGEAIVRALQDQLGLIADRGEALRPGRLGRLDAAADHASRATRRRHLRVRQALRGHARPLRPLVQARPHAALRPAGGREAVPQRAPAGPVRGLRPAPDVRRRAAGGRTRSGIVEITPEREYLLVTEFFDGAREIGEAEVDDADHRPGAGRRPPDVGDRAGPPRHQAGQPAGARRARWSSSTPRSPRCGRARGGRRSTWPT